MFLSYITISHEDESSFSYDEEKDNNSDQTSIFSALSCGNESRVSSEGVLTDAEWPDMGDGSNSITQSTLSQSISLALPNLKRGRGRPKQTKKGSSNSLPPGVNETTSGNYQVLLYYQGNNRNIGSFKTLQSATLVSEIVRNMLKKDKGQKLSAEECERNVKLAKEAALAGVPNNEMCSKSTKRGGGRPRKVNRKVNSTLSVSDLQMNDCRDEDLEGGLSTNGRKRKLSKKKADVLLDQQTAKRSRGRPKKGSSALPKGVDESTAGIYRVRVFYQGSSRGIGTFQTLEQATLANEIARNMIEKDKGLQLSPEECERNFKLAKDTALTAAMPDRKKTSSSVPRGKAQQKKQADAQHVQKSNGMTEWQCPKCSKKFAWKSPQCASACISNHMRKSHGTTLPTMKELSQKKKETKKKSVVEELSQKEKDYCI